MTIFQKACKMVLSKGYEVKMTKAELRKQILEIRKNVTKKEHDELSKVIFDKVVAFPEFEDSQNIFIFVAYNNEVDTKLLIKYALATGKTVAVPCIKGEGHMIAVEIRSWDSLKKNAYGILEPIDETNQVAKASIDLAIIPGSVFDCNMDRIGYGKGYYDNFLNNTNIRKIALAYDFQIVDKVPAEEHDIKMDVIVTPTRIIQK
jgi:5-formyltetrahydrofolate cyclo-ligase